MVWFFSQLILINPLKSTKLNPQISGNPWNPSDFTKSVKSMAKSSDLSEISRLFLGFSDWSTWKPLCFTWANNHCWYSGQFLTNCPLNYVIISSAAMATWLVIGSGMFIYMDAIQMVIFHWVITHPIDGLMVGSLPGPHDGPSPIGPLFAIWHLLVGKWRILHQLLLIWMSPLGHQTHQSSFQIGLVKSSTYY